MSDLYDSIRKSMFAYFCKHNSHIIEENFAVPRKVKIAKKAQRTLPRRYYLNEKVNQVSAGVKHIYLEADRIGEASTLVVDKAVVSNSIC